MSTLSITALLLTLLSPRLNATNWTPATHEQVLQVTVPDELDLYIEQLAFLEARDCHCFQGFLFSEAMAPGEFAEFAATHS